MIVIKTSLLASWQSMCARLKLAEICQSIFFSLMADEYTDVSNKEQVSICLC